MLNLWWSAERSEQKMSTEMQKNEKGSLGHRKIKCLFFDYIQLLMIGRGIWAKNINRNVKKQKRHPKSSKNKMLIFGLRSTSDVRPSDPKKKLSTKMQKDKKGTLSHQKIKCSFLNYAQLLMIGRSGQWTRRPSATPLQSKKIKCSFMDYVPLLMTGQAGQWTRTPSATPLQPKRWNAHFWITFNSWWLVGLVDGLEPNLQPKK